MPYLEVRVENGAGGSYVTSANGISLAKSNGCLASLFGSMYPSAIDYFNGLAYEGWTLVSSQSNSSFGMIDGLPFANNWGNYFFTGNGRFEIEWDDKGWHFKGGYQSFSADQDYDDYDNDDNQDDYDRYVDEQSERYGPV